MAGETKEKVSEILKIKDDYVSFCVNEASLYIYMKWKAGEKTYREKLFEQNQGFLKPNKKDK